jgi:hypothetical protein
MILINAIERTIAGKMPALRMDFAHNAASVHAA